MAKSMFDDLFKKYIGSTAREHGYAYGDILPFRMKTDAQGRTIPGTVDWGLAYSNAAKGMFDTLMAPRQAMQGQEFTPEQAMSFAANVTAPGVATARYSPGMFNMPMVYHGTPHRFEATPENPLGEFRASQIGTGEGAQAYGHGIYVAESPKVAQLYKDTVGIGSQDRPAPDDSIAADIENLNFLPDDIDEYYDLAKSRAEKIYFKNGKLTYEFEDGSLGSFNDDGQFKSFAKPESFLYTADLPDEMVDRMLDWDKPLSEQSLDVQKKIQQVIDQEFGKGTWSAWAKSNPDYRDLRDSLFENKTEPEISELFRQAGIPGIKYLDAGSRGDKAKPTRNFVLFPGEEKKAKIIKRE